MNIAWIYVRNCKYSDISFFGGKHDPDNENFLSTYAFTVFQYIELNFSSKRNSSDICNATSLITHEDIVLSKMTLFFQSALKCLRTLQEYDDEKSADADAGIQGILFTYHFHFNFLKMF